MILYIFLAVTLSLLVIITAKKTLYVKKFRFFLYFLFLLILALVFLRFGQTLTAAFTFLLPIIYHLMTIFIRNFSIFKNIISFISRKKNLKFTDTSMIKAYEVLGLNKNASNKEINDQYKKLIKILHPDKGGSKYLSSLVNQAKKNLLKKK